MATCHWCDVAYTEDDAALPSSNLGAATVQMPVSICVCLRMCVCVFDMCEFLCVGEKREVVDHEGAICEM